MYFNESFSHLQTCLTSLVKPVSVFSSFCFPVERCLSSFDLCFQFRVGEDERRGTVTPSLEVTVLAHTPIVTCEACQVLVQGCVVDSENVDAVLDLIQRGLQRLEQNIAKCFQPIAHEFMKDQKEVSWLDSIDLILIGSFLCCSCLILRA